MGWPTPEPAHILFQAVRETEVTEASCTCGQALGFHSGDGRDGYILAVFNRHLVAAGVPPGIDPRSTVELAYGRGDHGLGTWVLVLGRTAHHPGPSALGGVATDFYSVLVPAIIDGARHPWDDVILNDVADWELRVVVAA